MEFWAVAGHLPKPLLDVGVCVCLFIVHIVCVVNTSAQITGISPAVFLLVMDAGGIYVEWRIFVSIN